MADAWPTKEVAGGEMVGRRIYSAKEVSEGTIEPDIFDDTRITDGLSFDRLGQGGQINNKVVKYLTPLCDNDAKKLKTAFWGWAALQSKVFKHVDGFQSDPLSLAVDGTENPYHALLNRTDMRNKRDTFRLARSLYNDFSRSGGIFVKPIRDDVAN